MCDHSYIHLTCYKKIYFYLLNYGYIQNLGLRHDEETRSENAAELRIEIENEDDSADISSMDVSGNSKEDVGNDTNEGVLSEFCASRRSASLESLSTASILARASREHWANQNSSEESIELNESESTCDGNEISTGIRNLCVDRVRQKEQMIRRSQSAGLLR